MTGRCRVRCQGDGRAADPVALVTADITQAKQRGGPDGLVGAARQGRRGFLLQPEWNDGDVLGVTVPNNTTEPLTGPGRGLWCEDGSLRVAQLVAPPTASTTLA